MFFKCRTPKISRKKNILHTLYPRNKQVKTLEVLDTIILSIIKLYKRPFYFFFLRSEICGVYIL